MTRNEEQRLLARMQDWLADPAVAAWYAQCLSTGQRHVALGMLELADITRAKFAPMRVDVARALDYRTSNRPLQLVSTQKDDLKMSIPGLEPVPAAQESFSFKGAVPDKSSNTTERPSKYFFEEGDYPATAVSIKEGIAKSSNAPQYILTLLGTGGKAKGIDYRVYLPLTGPGVGITERTLKVFGVKAEGTTKNENGEDVPNYVFSSTDVVGKSVTMKLVQNEYEGKKNMKVKAIFALKAAPDTTNLPPI